MSINTSVQTFTDTELLNLYRLALAKIAAGQSYQMNGRMLTNADLKDVREQIDWLEARINAAAAGVDGDAVLGVYGERQ